MLNLSASSLLLSYTEELIFRIAYIDFTFSGDVQCVLSIPGIGGDVGVFQGAGLDEVQAKDRAAKNALSYLHLFLRTNCLEITLQKPL